MFLLVLALCFALVFFHFSEVESVGAGEVPEDKETSEKEPTKVKEETKIEELMKDTHFWAKWWEEKYWELRSTIENPPEILPKDLSLELERWVGTESYWEVHWKMKTRALERLTGLTVTLEDRLAGLEKLTDSMGKLDIPLENTEKTLWGLADSKVEEKLGSCVGIENKVVASDIYDNKLSIETKVEIGEVELKVSSEEEMKKTIIINIDNQTLPVSKPTDVLVLYDGGEISLADNYEDVLNPLDDISPEYLLLFGKNGMQALVSVSLSEHTITIKTKIAEPPSGPSEAPSEPPNIWLLASACAGVAITAGLALAFYRKKIRR